MRYWISFCLIALYSLVLSVSCGDNEGVPVCIQDIIDGKNNPVPDSPEYILRYVYKGKTVYYLFSGCCDKYNYLLDTKCDILCSPDGGEFGDGDGMCPDFRDEAQVKDIIWCVDQATCDSLEDQLDY